MAALEIVESGVLIQLQDLGRYGVAEHGLSQGGAMDLHAYCWANLLLNNDPNATQIEITLGQACFKVLEDCCIALTGADMNATLDGKVLVPWQTYQLTQGQILQFGYSRDGLRAYLAIKGGFDNQTCFGSASTVQRNHLGGIDGKGGALAVGQCLYAKKSSSPYRYQAVPARFIPRYQHEITVSVIESYQADSFTAEQKARFYSSGYQLTQHSDRMGCRLTGAKIIPQHAGLISQPIAKGAIQVPPDGEPIVLLNDRQTLGGYPIIGCITQHDLSLVSQLKPGDTIRFACLTPQQFELEQQKWFTFCRFFNVFQT
ncbi:biotin-dependent carboxyltransferase family protein [Photobacterium leiognathi]|uniref:5-oxoprolinase subunit C family protein n=1 Tax=Photobacterium leiognathi TaxID=553611 RepID=UPI0027335937|nr:biotin-dependent carboxyltransferase family protein [Photobacterium leiognathi]